VQNFTPVGPRIQEISRGKKTSGLKLKSAPQAITSGWTKKYNSHETAAKVSKTQQYNLTKHTHLTNTNTNITDYTKLQQT